MGSVFLWSKIGIKIGKKTRWKWIVKNQKKYKNLKQGKSCIYIVNAGFLGFLIVKKYIPKKCKKSKKNLLGNGKILVYTKSKF